MSMEVFAVHFTLASVFLSTDKTGQSEVGAWSFLDGVTSPLRWLTPVY